MTRCVTLPLHVRISAAIALAIVASAVQAGGCPEAVVRVELRSHADIEGPTVKLRDIATAQGGCGMESQELLARDFGPAPHPGETMKLDRMRVAAWLQQASRQSLRAAWRLSGSATVEIRRLEQWVDVEQLLNVARQSLETWLRPRSDHFEIVQSPRFDRVSAPVGEITFRPREFPDNLRPTRRMQVWIDVFADGRFVRTIATSFDVHAYGWGWVARDDADTGQILRESALEKKEVDLALLKAEPLIDITANRRLKRRVPAGQVMLLSDVEGIPAIQRGERVAVRSHIGIIHLMTSGRALQEGRIGQRVLVSPTESNRPIAAFVVDHGLVEVLQ